MPKRRTLMLTDEQRSELLNGRDRHTLPYMRERAAALLFIASGSAPAVVAREYLWRSRDPDPLYSWLDRYQASGLAGLLITAGRGRKPAFSPLYQTGEEAKEALAHLIRRDPRQLGVERTRWNLPSLLAHLTTFHLKGTSSLWHMLNRLGIRWLRGRAHVHSPDPL